MESLGNKSVRELTELTAAAHLQELSELKSSRHTLAQDALHGGEKPQSLPACSVRAFRSPIPVPTTNKPQPPLGSMAGGAGEGRQDETSQAM